MRQGNLGSTKVLDTYRRFAMCNCEFASLYSLLEVGSETSFNRSYARYVIRGGPRANTFRF